jgi:hypothetical protein
MKVCILGRFASHPLPVTEPGTPGDHFGRMAAVFHRQTGGFDVQGLDCPAGTDRSLFLKARLN